MLSVPRPPAMIPTFDDDEDAEVLRQLPSSIHRYAFEHFSYRDMNVALGSVLDFEDAVSGLYRGHGVIGASALLSWKPSLANIVLAHAAYFGHDDIFRFVHTTFSLSVRRELMELACRNGQLTVVEYLESQRCPVGCLDAAASNGHLDVLEFLKSRRPNEFVVSHAAMANAARNGHADVVAFLYECNVDCQAGAFTDAAANGHIDVVKFIMEHYHDTDLEKEALWQATRHGRLAVVHYLAVQYVRTNGFK
ncbi:unnamed protein product [Aphanomyces euteiches]|uniref:Uncharacterized protein n=1 Tax=Aphanomyces euteiches TaxID=100861 RepID=A0A6G0WHV4_9STRA|nr:hypothetical protein Ae201684_015031 [Aphanomyces euteiches]KAH9062901.1 hypothetical protein Ae201684P_009167 [Aphanomyces euteiches]KAH9102880.1 hypothetical protein LEN26_015443 [Aphanomyces euteiches]KAH9126254.1 hypothetical protein AeMF1_003321 [Aphanomyces euteiches]KAH9154827.1 hypothetical protein AeRB84_003150 [Aphanomyces euteiches]